jgi:hypothetical protein
LSSKANPRLWQTGLLALGLLAGCGGSASHHEADAQPPSSTAGAASGPLGTGGGNATAGGTVALAGGGNGTSAGGGPDGGSSQDLGGTAAAGAAPALPLPPGCQPRTPVETADLCSLAVDCDASPSVRTYCHRLDSGRWECQCANQDSIYRLENAAGIQACALAARLCSDKDLELGEESCEPTSESSDQDSCTIDVACSSAINLDATTDAQAWLMRFGSARCDRSDPGTSFACACSGGALTSNYDLLADSGELACAPLADFCMSGRAPVFDGEEKCSPIYATSDNEGCGRAEGCGAQMALTDDVSLAQLEERYARCEARPGGGSECSCSGPDSAFLFQLSTAPDDASCAASIPNCDPNAVVETTGPASCEFLAFDTDGDDMCRAVLSCVQDATVDNRSIVARGSMVLVCRRAETGMPWVCSCASGPETARLELGAAGADASQACNQASAAFLERPGLHLGPSVDLMEPPDPFP